MPLMCKVKIAMVVRYLVRIQTSLLFVFPMVTERILPGSTIIVGALNIQGMLWITK
jgi:hypothetical protein